MPLCNREQYNNFKRGTKNRIKTLTTPSPKLTHPNMANRFHHFLHSTLKTPSTHNEDGHFRNHTYHATQTRHAQDTTPFK